MEKNGTGYTGAISQSCLITAASGEEALATALDIAAAALCTGSGSRPCRQCSHCRKVAGGIHPDVITIGRLEDDKGRLKREIGVDQIRALSADAYILPNEAGRKVYIIRDAETMNIPAQNAALKLLEEPPLGAVFLLCTTNPGQLLPTVRSRCTQINCVGEPEAQDKELEALADAYIKAVASGDRAKLYTWCCVNETMDSRRAAAFVDCAMARLGDLLCGRKKNPSLSSRQLMKLYELLGRCAAYLRLNVGSKHIFGLLAVDSIAGGGNRG